MLQIKKILGTLLILTAFLTGGAFTALAAESDGTFDELENNTISGWAWDSSTPNTAVPVTISITNQETGEQIKTFHPTAITYRSELEEQGYGNGRHGFQISMNWDALEDGTYIVEGNVDGKAFSNSKTYVKGETVAAEESSPSEETHDHPHLKSLGLFRTTGYCPCKQCSEGWGRHTSTGSVATSGHTIAVDPRVIPYGSKVMIGGVIYTAEDRGGGVKGNHVDIFFDTHAQTRQHGKQTQEVFLVLG